MQSTLNFITKVWSITAINPNENIRIMQSGLIGLPQISVHRGFSHILHANEYSILFPHWLVGLEAFTCVSMQKNVGLFVCCFTSCLRIYRPNIAQAYFISKGGPCMKQVPVEYRLNLGAYDRDPLKFYQ